MGREMNLNGGCLWGHISFKAVSCVGFLLVVNYLSCVAQETEMENAEEIWQELLQEREEQEGDGELLIEEFDVSRLNLIDLNSATSESLRRLGFLSPFQIASILNYRDQTGAFLSILELQAIDGLDVKTRTMLLPFVRVSTASTLQQIISGQEWTELLKHDLMLRFSKRLETTKGYQKGKDGKTPYLGSPERLLARYRFQLSPELSVALNMKKDPGEGFLTEDQKLGFDFISGSIALRNQKALKTFVIGDFGLQWGQGLNMWIGSAFGKGAIAHGPVRTPVVLKPYTSSGESGFLRGSAAHFQWGLWNITPFVSYRALDATRKEDADGRTFVETIATSGLHRTENERLGKRQLGQWLYGIHSALESRHSMVGFAYHHVGFQVPLKPTDDLRQIHAFSGASGDFLSAHGSGQFKNMYYFGEWSGQWGAGHAWTAGIMSALGRSVSALVIYRDFDASHGPQYAQPMAENSRPSNEEGLYTGVSYQINRYSEWVVYVDAFRFPWLKYRVDAPSRGLDLFSQVHYRWGKNIRIQWRFRLKQSEQNRLDEFGHRILIDIEQQQTRIDLEWTMNDQWKSRFRMAANVFKEDNLFKNVGSMAYADLFYHPMMSKFSGNLRISYIRSPSFDTRFYAYESDVLYGNSMPIYDKAGWRGYVNLKGRLLKQLDLWVKYGLFWYSKTDEIGSGNEASIGNIKSEVKVQTRWRF